MVRDHWAGIFLFGSFDNDDFGEFELAMEELRDNNDDPLRLPRVCNQWEIEETTHDYVVLRRPIGLNVPQCFVYLKVPTVRPATEAQYGLWFERNNE